MLSYTLYTLFILACLVLVIVVLLQPGKADAGALFTSSVSSTAFGPRGTQNILAKVTIGAAISFMLLALLLALPGLTGSNSVLQSATVPVASPSPSPSATATPAATPATTPAASPSATAAATPSAKPAASAKPTSSPAAAKKPSPAK